MNLIQKIIHGGAIAGTSAFVMGSFWYYFTIVKQMKNNERIKDGLTLFRLDNIADTNKIIGSYIGFFGGILIYNSSKCIFKKLKNM